MRCDVDWVGLGWVKVEIGLRVEKKKKNGKDGESWSSLVACMSLCRVVVHVG